VQGWDLFWPLLTGGRYMDTIDKYKLNRIFQVLCILNIIWVTTFCSSSNTWTIVRIPIDLKKERSLSHSFVANRTFKFTIQLEAKIGENTVPHFGRLLTDEINIDWKVFNKQTLIASGKASGPMTESFWGGGRGSRVLGKFDAIESMEYTIELKINQDAPNLSKADPQILIEPDRELYKTGGYKN
jgi:hypothetical protein